VEGLGPFTKSLLFFCGQLNMSTSVLVRQLYGHFFFNKWASKDSHSVSLSVVDSESSTISLLFYETKKCGHHFHHMLMGPNEHPV
jgi:hypothetical protein